MRFFRVQFVACVQEIGSFLPLECGKPGMHLVEENRHWRAGEGAKIRWADDRRRWCDGATARRERLEGGYGMMSAAETQEREGGGFWDEEEGKEERAMG